MSFGVFRNKRFNVRALNLLSNFRRCYNIVYMGQTCLLPGAKEFFARLQEVERKNPGTIVNLDAAMSGSQDNTWPDSELTRERLVKRLGLEFVDELMINYSRTLQPHFPDPNLNY